MLNICGLIMFGVKELVIGAAGLVTVTTAVNQGIEYFAHKTIVENTNSTVTEVAKAVTEVAKAVETEVTERKNGDAQLNGKLIVMADSLEKTAAVAKENAKNIEGLVKVLNAMATAQAAPVSAPVQAPAPVSAPAPEVKAAEAKAKAEAVVAKAEPLKATIAEAVTAKAVKAAGKVAGKAAKTVTLEGNEPVIKTAPIADAE